MSKLKNIIQLHRAYKARVQDKYLASEYSLDYSNDSMLQDIDYNISTIADELSLGSEAGHVARNTSPTDEPSIRQIKRLISLTIDYVDARHNALTESLGDALETHRDVGNVSQARKDIWYQLNQLGRS